MITDKTPPSTEDIEFAANSLCEVRSFFRPGGPADRKVCAAIDVLEACLAYFGEEEL